MITSDSDVSFRQPRVLLHALAVPTYDIHPTPVANISHKRPAEDPTGQLPGPLTQRRRLTDNQSVDMGIDSEMTDSEATGPEHSSLLSADTSYRVAPFTVSAFSVDALTVS